MLTFWMPTLKTQLWLIAKIQPFVPILVTAKTISLLSGVLSMFLSGLAKGGWVGYFGLLPLSPRGSGAVPTPIRPSPTFHRHAAFEAVCTRATEQEHGPWPKGVGTCVQSMRDDPWMIHELNSEQLFIYSSVDRNLSHESR